MTKNIFGSTREELVQYCTEAGHGRFRGEQLFRWLYNTGVSDFEHCRNLPSTLRAQLTERFSILHPTIEREQRSTDGTSKYLFRLRDSHAVETVLIPSESNDEARPRRRTLCLSTQVGCPLNCSFCATASMKLKRNLDVGEIVGQYLAVQQASGDRISNLVFMGMGEALLNYDNVMNATDIIADEAAGAVGFNRITISTVGLVDGIKRLADEGRKTKLAISLHAVTDELRQRLIPIGKKYPLSTLLEAVDYYYRKTRRAITWEYILFDGINDGERDIRGLAKIARRNPGKVNLIPYHPSPDAWPTGQAPDLTPTPHGRIEEFAGKLRATGVPVMLRSSSGLDIDAACGQLAIRHDAIHSPSASLPDVDSKFTSAEFK